MTAKYIHRNNSLLVISVPNIRAATTAEIIRLCEIASDYETKVLKKNKKTIESTINIADNLI